MFQPNCDTHQFLFKNKGAGKYGSNIWILSDQQMDWKHLKKPIISHFRGFSGGAVGPPANTGDTRDAGSIIRSGISHGEGNGNPLQYSRLENPMDRRDWQTTVPGGHRVGHN